jgi:peptidoglycan hydrolase CwlO-like protein
LKTVVAVLAISVLALIAALFVTASGASSDRDDQSARIDAQQKQLTTLLERVRKAEQAVSGPQGEVASKLSKLQRRTKSIEDCIPELQTEVNSLTIDRESLLISPSNQISRVCSSTLYGSEPGD